MKKFLFYLILCSACFVFSQTNVTTYTYAIKGLDTLKMDVYTPKVVQQTDSVAFPVLLWMHGGGFSGGRRDYPDERKLAEIAAEKGYLGVSMSYRLTRKDKPEGFGCNCPSDEKLLTFKNAVEDYLDAAKFIYENQKPLRADTLKIIAGGSSAGAEAILNAVYMKSFFIDDVAPYQDIKFAGVLSLAGAMVNANYITEHNAVPTVLFHGTHDNLVPFDSAPHHLCPTEKPGYLILDGSNTVAEKLKTFEKPFYLHKVYGGKHELSSIPFAQLDAVFNFLEDTIFKKSIIQITEIVRK